MSDHLVNIAARPAPEGEDSLAFSGDFASQRGAKRELVEELRSRREAGDAVQPEELLKRWPGDPGADPDVASLLFEDYRQRREAGEDASIVDYERRFPQQHDSLAALVRQHAVWRSLKGTHG